MASNLVLSVREGSVAFGEKVIFHDLTFNIHERDKICLVGKNGAGKTTLMNIITGAKDLDDGERWVLQGTKIGYLQQEVIPKEGQTVYDFVFEQLKAEGVEEINRYKVEMVIQPLELDPTELMTKLSGGQLRRAALARALVEEPEVLLLDEPTNHLDLDVIEWLEIFLKSYRGALLCVSHDKTFLATISDKIFWLDRGRMRVCPKGFAHFDEWSSDLLEQEERELQNRTKFVEQEVEWASRGVKARRKRNIRRLEIMKEERERLKRDQSSYRQATRTIDAKGLEDMDATSSHVIAEFFKVFKLFEDGGRKKTILNNFSFKIVRGDRIGILGKNGSGKTSFLKLLIGELKADAGKVKLAKDLEFSYFDQQRRDLKPKETLHHILCPNGGEYLKVMGKTRHVCGYLKDFMFDPNMMMQTVGTLSGGQKNRLLLAKVLSDPKTLLILDEPTNDLDMDTLDMLEEILTRFQGTLVVVSHDRDFLDQTVTRILAFEGNGVVETCVGGYSDYLEHRKKGKLITASTADDEPEVTKPSVVHRSETDAAPQKSGRKLTYKLQFELDNLPTKIAALEKEVEELERILDDSDLYVRDRGGFDTASKRVAVARAELERSELRWLELDEMRNLANSNAG